MPIQTTRRASGHLMLCLRHIRAKKCQFRHLEGQVMSLAIQAAFCARTYTAKPLLISNLGSDDCSVNRHNDIILYRVHPINFVPVIILEPIIVAIIFTTLLMTFNCSLPKSRMQSFLGVDCILMTALSVLESFYYYFPFIFLSWVLFGPITEQ